MPIVSSNLLIFTHVFSAVGGFFTLFFALTAIYYSMKGKERIAGVAKSGMLILFICFIDSLFDSGASTFFYTRPTDVVTVYWFRQACSTFIMPLLFLGFFELLHNPAEINKVEDSAGSMKHGNEWFVYCMSKWVVLFYSFIGEALGLASVLSDSFAVRWTSYAISLFIGITAFAAVYYYISTHGMRAYTKKTISTAVRYAIWGRKGTKTLSAMFAWILIILFWIAKWIIFGCGPALGSVIGYDWEASGYMIIELVLIIALYLAAYAARVTHRVAGSVVMLANNLKDEESD
jgi:hypothetical protein